MDDDEPSLRFMASDGSEQCHVTVQGLAIPDENGNNVQVRVEGKDSGVMAAVSAALKTLGPLPPGTLSERVDAGASSLKAHLQRKGLEVKDLPDGDVQFRFELDMDTGRAVGQQSTLHEDARVPAELAQRLHEVIAGSLGTMASEVITQIEQLIESNQLERAADFLTEQGSLVTMSASTEALLAALQKLDAAKLDESRRRTFLLHRVSVAARSRQYALAEPDATALLREFKDLPQEQRASLENIVAIAAAQGGQPETALAIWRRLMRTPERLHPGERAWVYHNISSALRADDPEAVRTARLAADAFLAAGQKKDALGSLMHLSDLLERQSLEAALKQYDAILALVDESSLLGKEYAAAVHHIKASGLMAARADESSLEEALKAVDLRRGLTGNDNELLSSLNLAAIAARRCGDDELAQKLETEAAQIQPRASDPCFAIGRRLEELSGQWDAQKAQTLVEEARASRDPGLYAAVLVSVTMQDPQLDHIGRIRSLERSVTDVQGMGGKADDLEPAYLGIAHFLAEEGDFERSAIWWRKVLDIKPLSLDARESLLHCLGKCEKWGDAAEFLADWMERNGETPGLLFAYGRSLLEAGNYSPAATALHRSAKFAEQEELKAKATELRDRALDQGGQVQPDDKPLKPEGPVLRSEVEEALAEFAHFVKSEKRMRFWSRQGDGSHKWVSSPERLAQDFLHTFLRAWFQHRISVFEEVDAGAGRLDLLLQFEGGLSAILELKICGANYPSAYAASGEGQIRHYMDNRKVHLGYLVVLDGRLDTNGAPLIAGTTGGQNTVLEVLVDVQPRVSQRKRGAVTAEGDAKPKRQPKRKCKRSDGEAT
jgi:tetratricopeptide (TPR) repeat protein